MQDRLTSARSFQCTQNNVLTRCLSEVTKNLVVVGLLSDWPGDERVKELVLRLRDLVHNIIAIRSLFAVRIKDLTMKAAKEIGLMLLSPALACHGRLAADCGRLLVEKVWQIDALTKGGLDVGRVTNSTHFYRGTTVEQNTTRQRT